MLSGRLLRITGHRKISAIENFEAGGFDEFGCLLGCSQQIDVVGRGRVYGDIYEHPRTRGAKPLQGLQHFERIFEMLEDFTDDDTGKSPFALALSEGIAAFEPHFTVYFQSAQTGACR